MRGKTILALATLGALLFSSMAAAGPRWDNQVTGGGDFGAFDLAVSSRTAADGTTKGMFQYTRDDLVFHGDVDCFYVGADGVALSGVAKDQEGSVAEYASVEIRNDGLAVRVRASGDPYGENCGYSGSYPGSLVEGSFNLR